MFVFVMNKTQLREKQEDIKMNDLKRYDVCRDEMVELTQEYFDELFSKHIKLITLVKERNPELFDEYIKSAK